MSAGYPIEKTDLIVTCPVVPDGSTATMRFAGEDPGLTMGWYKDQVIYYFNFSRNVIDTLPSDPGYSPLWDVDVYDNASFDSVHDLASAQAAPVLGIGVALVNLNCPVVFVM